MHAVGRSFDSISPVGVREIACGFDHAVAVVADATLWSWGSNHRGTQFTGFTSATVQILTPEEELQGSWG